MCTADATKRGSVWGMDTYTGDSSVCRAALHAGVVGQSGGAVTAIAEPGRDAYPGVTRNGISSSNYGHYNSSFRFDAQAMPITLDDNPASKALLGKSAVGTH